MSTLPPHDVPAIFWIDGAGQQQGPEPLATVIERIAHDQIPSSTPVWWQGAVNWLPFNTNAELAAALDARLAPAPAPQPVAVPQSAPEASQPFATAAASPFSNPAPAESASPFSSPTAFDVPAAQEPTTAFQSPTTFESPATFEVPAAAAAPVASPFEVPAAFAPAAQDATISFDAPASYDAPAAFDTVPVETPAEAAAPYEAPIAVDTPADIPVVADVPEVIVPDEPVVLAPSLRLGDAAELESTFASLSERSAAFDAEVARAAALDETLAATVRQSLHDLGFTIEDTQTSDDYHSFRLSEPDGATASLAIQRIPAAVDVASAVERPVACFVDRADRASVGLFFGDYLDDDGTTDQARFTSDLASIVNAAGSKH